MHVQKLRSSVAMDRWDCKVETISQLHGQLWVHVCNTATVQHWLKSLDQKWLNNKCCHRLFTLENGARSSWMLLSWQKRNVWPSNYDPTPYFHFFPIFVLLLIPLNIRGSQKSTNYSFNNWLNIHCHKRVPNFYFTLPIQYFPIYNLQVPAVRFWLQSPVLKLQNSEISLPMYPINAPWYMEIFN